MTAASARSGTDVARRSEGLGIELRQYMPLRLIIPSAVDHPLGSPGLLGSPWSTADGMIEHNPTTHRLKLEAHLTPEPETPPGAQMEGLWRFRPRNQLGSPRD